MIEWKLEREVSDAMDGLQVMANDVDYNPVGWSCFFRDDRYVIDVLLESKQFVLISSSMYASPHGFDKSRRK
jgi:hypothetical protein